MASRACGHHLAEVAAALGYTVTPEKEGAYRPFRIHLTSKGRNATREFNALRDAAFDFHMMKVDRGFGEVEWRGVHIPRPVALVRAEYDNRFGRLS